MSVERVARGTVLLATALPPLLAFTSPPSPTVLGQCLALGLWGWAAGAFAPRAQERHGLASWRDAGSLHLLVLCCVAAAVVSLHASRWPVSIALCTLLALLAFSVVVLLASELARDERAAIDRTQWFLFGLLAAGLLSAAIGVLQVAWPDVPDGNWIARSSLPGRAVGNLRQPNHLSSLLLWSLIAVVGLVESGRLRLPWAVASGSILMCGLVLTGSRTGVLGALLLAAWGLIDGRLSKRLRVSLALTPIAFLIAWVLTSTWADTTGHVMGAEGRIGFSHGGDISSSRFAIWSNTLAMIVRERLTGVGLGEFNLAWTLSAFADRPTAFFDHTHNIVLQMLVEFGLPLGSVAVGLLLLALYQAVRRAWAADGDIGVVKRTACVLVLMMGLHSLLEYPLWYVYFLLPMAFAWGVALSRPGETPADHDHRAHWRWRSLWTWIGSTMVLGSFAATLDYHQVAVIYNPPDDAAPLEDRIARGQRSPLFGHHADYAAATAFGPPKAPLSPMQEGCVGRAPHQLLDVRLMIAWSQALAAQGDLDKARWLAARIREFRNPGADEYFAPCSDPAQAAQAFQCQPPTRDVHWREFVQR